MRKKLERVVEADADGSGLNNSDRALSGRVRRAHFECAVQPGALIRDISGECSERKRPLGDARVQIEHRIGRQQGRRCCARDGRYRDRRARRAPFLVDPAEDTAQVGVPPVCGLPVIVGGHRQTPLGDVGYLVAG